MLFMGEIDTKIEVASWFRVTDWWNFSVSSPYNRLYWVRSGSATVTHSGRKFKLLPGNLYLIPCFRTAHYRCDEFMDHVFIHFTSRLPTGIDLCNTNAVLFHRSVTDIDQNTEQLSKLLELSREDSIAAMLNADGILRQLLSGLVSEDRSVYEKIVEASRFSTVFDFINRNLGEALVLADLAAVANLHPTYFSNSFSTAIGESPMRFLTRRRIEKAQQLLWSTDLSVTAIGNEVGYPDSAHFSRVFSKEVTMSPSAYRRKREFPILR